jgi:glucose/arabinose dehydrogenase
VLANQRRSLILLLVLACGVQAANASQGGRSGFSGNPDTSAGAVCSVCHGPDGAPVSTVFISGPSVVDAGTLNEYLVTITGGPAVIGGVGISVSDEAGSLEPIAADLLVLDGELTHSNPKPFAGGMATFAFRYLAPNYDAEVTLYAASNSANGGLDLAGDAIASTSLAVTVQNGFEPPPPPPPPAVGELEALAFATGLASPVVITHAGDARLFVVEQDGVIRVVLPNGTVRPTPFLDIDTLVDSGASEQGLLGLAFHPDYTNNGHFFVYYTRDPGPGNDLTRISRFSVSGDPNIADPGSELVLMEFEQPFSNHNGGDIHFGPDGYLYIASGDGGSGGDPQDNSQNSARLLGKILRIDVDGTPGAGDGPDCDISGFNNYRIPPGNAYTDGAGGAGCDEVYVLGVRNPWRFSFDQGTGAMWIGDVGQNSVEEIDYVPAGASGGLNLGWRCYEGSAPHNLTDCNLDYQFPVYEYSHGTGDCSVTGGVVYRGQAFPVLDGQYFFSDYCRPSIRALSGPPGDLTVREVLPSGVVSAPAEFGEDINGEVYVADIATGTIYQLVAVLGPGDVDGDGDVDRDDLRPIMLALGTPASGPDDRRDVDGNGFITQLDFRLAIMNCDRPQCATE